MVSKNKIESGSFRDPSGFIFTQNKHVFRQINKQYKEDYEFLMTSGLYKRLVDKQFLIPHQEKKGIKLLSKSGYKIIEPQLIPFISYPYEWSFSQLKDAALLTLEVQKEALGYDMVLKDASAFNIQFFQGRPILIDTLSFSKYEPGKPWIAYRQYCQHFLSPLALMSYSDIRLNKLSQIHVDGIPLDLASKLLPKITWKNIGILFHIHLHAASQNKFSQIKGEPKVNEAKVSKASLTELCNNIKNTVNKLIWKPDKTTWAGYYDETNYQDSSFIFKKQFVSEVTKKIKPGLIWDLGANTGIFSKQCLGSKDSFIVSSDIDPGAVEINYLDCKKSNYQNILPLIIDLTNPSPNLGWNNKERKSFLDRGPADMILALALIHHLAISNNVPFESISEFFAEQGKYLIIEFIPKEDSQVKKLLSTRDDIFPDYSVNGFLDVFLRRYSLLQREPIPGSERELFVFKRK